MNTKMLKAIGFVLILLTIIVMNTYVSGGPDRAYIPATQLGEATEECGGYIPESHDIQEPTGVAHVYVCPDGKQINRYE